MAEKISVSMKVVQPHIDSSAVYRSYYGTTALIPALDVLLRDFTERFSYHFANATKLSLLIPAIVHDEN